MEEEKEYLDETILELRRLKQKENSDEIYIKGELLEFESVKLFDDKMEIKLPKTFVTMPLRFAKIKYPSEDRPHIIKTDLLGSTNFAFNLFDQPVQMSGLSDVSTTFKDVIKKVNPANIFFGSGEEELEDGLVSWFDYKSYAVDTQVYYIYYVTVIDGNLLHGIFNCMMEDMKDYKDVAFYVMKSIKDLTGGNEHA